MTPQDRLEEELRSALRREDAPQGFAERVLARVREEDTLRREKLWNRVLRFMHAPASRFAAAAALCMVIVGGSLEYRHYQREQQAGEVAKQQLMLALRITGSKLQYAQAKVNQVSSQQYGPVQENDEERQ